MLKKFSLLSNLLALAVSGISLVCILLLMNMQTEVPTEKIENNGKNIEKNGEKIETLEDQMVQVQDYIETSEENITTLEDDVDSVKEQQESFLRLMPDEDEEEEKEEDEKEKEKERESEPEEKPKEEPEEEEEEVTKVKVDTNYLHFRDSPGLDGKIIGSFNTGDTLEDSGKVTKEDDYWWRKVSKNGDTGWVASRYVN